MDKVLQKIEEDLERLSPRGLSDAGQQSCESLIDQLSRGEVPQRVEQAAAVSPQNPVGLGWKALSISAAAALTVGLASGLWLGGGSSQPAVVQEPDAEIDALAGTYELIERQTWLDSSDGPEVYFAENGEAREVFEEVETTMDTVKHRETGDTVRVQRRDHRVIDSAKEEF